MKLLRFLPLVLVGLVVAALVWRLANPPDTNVESGMVGKPVPAFAADAALPGKPSVSSADLSDGRPKLVNFFASWCVPCVGEAPVLTMLKQQGVPIVGIAVRDRPDDVAAFLARNGNPYEEIGSDPQSKVQIAFGSSGVPETFVIDPYCTIRHQHIGAIDEGDVPAIRKQWEDLRK